MFEIKQTLLCQDVRAYYLARMHNGEKNPTGRFWAIFVGGIIFLAGIFGFWNFAVIIIRDSIGLGDIIPMLFSLMMCFFLLDAGVYIAFRVEILTFIFTMMGHKSKGEENEFRFDPDAFTQWSQFGVFQFFYSAVFQIVEDKTHYFIFTYTGLNYTLRKDSFLQGDPEQFRDFIQAKTGVKIKNGK